MTRSFVDLQMPFADSSVGALRYAAGTDAAQWTLPVLASRSVEHGRLVFTAEVLGCSHRVELRAAQSGRVLFEEVVACEQALDTRLPRRHACAEGHAFSSRVDVVAAHDDWEVALGDALDELEGSAGSSLVARFPDERGGAVTALAWTLGPGRSLRWATLHAYPGERTLVGTETRIESRIAQDEPRGGRAPKGLARLAGIALSALVLAGCGLSADPKGYVEDRYEKVEAADEYEQGSAVFVSDKAPATVARDIIKHRKPAEKRITPAGWYLRYSKWMIAVQPSDEGGSRILVDSQGRGYTRHYGGVGGWWGTSSGTGENFRGGGPGSGK